MFRREHAPETLPDFARRVEAAGFDELWIVEDCFYTSGMASAAAALACTGTITVGLGIMPAVVRNPVFAAMEIATLARLYPGRFLPGFGHGVAGWMRQIGAFPKSQLQALEEVTLTTRRLLAGEHVDFEGQHVRLAACELVHPPDHVPPVSLGVIGPKSLALSGRVADGTILSEYASPAYVTWAHAQIAQGQQEAGRGADHRITIFAFAGAGAATAEARAQLRPMIADAIASGDIDAKLAPLGILPQARALRESGERAQLEAGLEDAWIDALAIAGTPEDWRTAIDRFTAVGAHSVVLVPQPEKNVDELEVFAEHLRRGGLL
ncbi:MAG: LLM class flavin-dependent oxidoreductase [Anaerolineae bacterium]|nr:LLM class flavin-dependent oxidoreductase [Anaerolineae bacterium]